MGGKEKYTGEKVTLTKEQEEFIFGPYATQEKLQSLLDEGFKPYRKIISSREGDMKIEYRPCNINLFYLRANFNIQIPNGSAIFLKKDEEEYFFGLNYKDKPIALIKQPNTTNESNQS